jgi:hypothetical protein
MANLSNTASANQVAFGQLGSQFRGDTTAFATPPDNTVIVAIQFTEDSTITTLTAESTKFPDNTQTSGSTLPKGLTIYGRWTALQLATGAAVAYYG